MINNKKFNIFIDFDGTVTTTDVGEAMFMRFGDKIKSQEIINEWIDNKIGSVETWQRLCSTVQSLNREKFDQFLTEIEIDEYFPRFAEHCRENGYKMTILSDGLDYYISRILKRYGFSDIPFFSNKLTFSPGNELIPSFPWRDSECTQCANCKRNHIITGSGDDEITIYIGDGYSDTCAAQYCDYIFAKNSLLKFCEKNRISYFPLIISGIS